jgi:predicted nucleotidyltransferase
MELFGLLRDISEAHRLKFVVIGGHAVNARGYSRTTLDLDLLVPKRDSEIWKNALGQVGYTVGSETSAFVQLTPPLHGLWPIDLMLVNETTFAGVWAEASEFLFREVSLKVPSLEHLIALKLHALKQALPHRDPKDFGDLTQLIQYNRVEVRSDRFRHLVEKYGSREIYDRIVKIVTSPPRADG